MILWHVTTLDLLNKYLESGKILAPVRAWKSLEGATRFAKQTDRHLIIRIKGNGEFKELGGHQNQAMVSDKNYLIKREDL